MSIAETVISEKSGNFNIVNSQVSKNRPKITKTHWKYHKLSTIMLISLKNKVQNSLGIDFDDFIQFLKVLKAVLKILPIDHT